MKFYEKLEKITPPPPKKKMFFEVDLDFGTNWAPLLVPKVNELKSHNRSILQDIKKLIDGRLDFFSMMAPSWALRWGHAGNNFATRRFGR